MRRIFLLIAGLFLMSSGYAQTTADIGLWGGGAGIQGDLEDISLDQMTFPALGAFVRYNFHYRTSLRLMFLTGKISGSGTIQNNLWEYSKGVNDLTLQAEINYLRYALGNKKASFSAYVTAGLGLLYHKYAYDPEFMMMINPATNKGAEALEQRVLTPTLPVGMGFKFNVGKRMGLGVEYQLRKLVDDRLDNLDDPLAHFNMDGREISYRDMIHNNDWLGFFGLHVTYRFYSGVKPCPAYDSKK